MGKGFVAAKNEKQQVLPPMRTPRKNQVTKLDSTA
jgi:hypothetical protein